MSNESKMKLLADAFVGWTTPYGRIDPEKCPFVETEQRVMPSNFHSPTYWAFGLYNTFSATGNAEYKGTADRLITHYFACLRNPRTQEQGPDYYMSEWLKFMEQKDESIEWWRIWANTCRSILAPPFMYGMALAGYRAFKRHNPNEMSLDTKAAALYEWLQVYRWTESSWFRCSYGSYAHGVVDVGFADDLCHIGRGLIAYYDVTKRTDVLTDALGLAQYYLNDMVVGTYKGCWSPELGTWAVGPTYIDCFEHFTGIRACDMAFVVTAHGIIQYLTELFLVVKDEPMRKSIAEKCVLSMRWIFDKCQFEDGAIGLASLDDAWLGSAGHAVMSYVKCRNAGFLSQDEVKEYGEKAVRARDWMLNELTPEGIEKGGYFSRTGHSTIRPLDNLAWLMGQALESMIDFEKLESAGD